MVIDIANFNFDGGSGGGGKPALLQEKTVTIVQNGSQTITPDEGFDGMSSVQINAEITCDSSSIDFSPIGYSDEFSAELNANMNDNVAYSKTLYDAWNPSNTSASYLYKDDTKLVYAPNIDTSNVARMYSMFSGCKSLQIVPNYNTSNVNNMEYMFDGCSSITKLPIFDTSNVNSMHFFFRNCSSLTTIEGISFKSYSASTMSSSELFGPISNTSIRKAVFKDIGYQSASVQFNTERLDNWGVNTDEIQDARQSLIDSLITYSFDRASAGYPTCEIKLSSNTKQLLTEDEKAQITAKGFTIA